MYSCWFDACPGVTIEIHSLVRTIASISKISLPIPARKKPRQCPLKQGTTDGALANRTEPQALAQTIKFPLLPS